MPTAYTQLIYDGQSTTFRDFALRCARGNSHLAGMDIPLDAPLPQTIAPSLGFQYALDRAKDDLAVLEAMTTEDAERAAMAEYDAEVRRVMLANLESEAKRHRYEVILGEVEAWKPPTPRHEALKQSMLYQLRMDIRIHCRTYPEPVRMAGAVWLAANLEQAREAVRHAQHRVDFDKLSAAEATTWLDDLRDSLPRDVSLW